MSLREGTTYLVCPASFIIATSPHEILFPSLRTQGLGHISTRETRMIQRYENCLKLWESFLTTKAIVRLSDSFCLDWAQHLARSVSGWQKTDAAAQRVCHPSFLLPCSKPADPHPSGSSKTPETASSDSRMKTICTSGLRVGPEPARLLLLVATSKDGGFKAADLSIRESIGTLSINECNITLRNIRITYPNTNYVVDLAGGSNRNGTGILLWNPHGGPNQSWIPEPFSVTPPPNYQPLQNNNTYLVQSFTAKHESIDDEVY